MIVLLLLLLRHRQVLCLQQQQLDLVRVVSSTLSVLDSQPVRSRVECLAECVTAETCFAAYYDISTGLCQTINPGSVVQAPNGDRLIYMDTSCVPGKTCFNVLTNGNKPRAIFCLW